MITIRPWTGMQECCVINGYLKSRQHAKMDIFRSFRELVLKQLSHKLLNQKKNQKICEKSLSIVYANAKFELNNAETYLIRKNPKIIINFFGKF